MTAAAVTVTPPADSHATVFAHACAQNVADALGSQFLARLLLGASPGRGQPTGNDEVAAEGVALACLVCASLCRSSDNATCVDFYSPLLSPLVAVVQLPSHSPLARSFDAALDALAAIACASPAGALAVMCAGGVQAATAAMRAAGASLPGLSMLGAMLDASTRDASTRDAATQHLSDLASALPFICSAMESVAEDPAMGLHAVHVVAHILRLSADAAAASDVTSSVPPPWSCQLARGVVALLRARNLSSQARADCLSAASGAVNVLGSRWVTCLGGDLIAPLVEVIVVEATVALHHLVRQQPAAGDRAGSNTALHGFASEADYHRFLTLGACAALFDACLAALASQEEEEASARGGAAVGAAHHVPPSVAQRALGSLERMAEMMLDFLDEVTPGDRGPRPDDGDDAIMGEDGPGAWRQWDDPIVMVALNAVAAFLVEVPVALRDKLLRIMPRVMAATVAATAPAQCRLPAPDASAGVLFPPPLAPLVLSLELATDAEDPDDVDNPSFDAPRSTAAGRWGPNDPACALIDALVPMGVVPALCGLVAAGCSDGGGVEKQAAAAGNRTKVMRASLGVLSHIAARAVHAPQAATDPQAVEAAEHIARHVPEALAHVLEWGSRHAGVTGDDALFAAAVVDLQPRVVRAATAADVCAVLEALEP